MQGQGIGTFIINFIMDTFLNYKVARCQFITVDSLNNPKTNLITVNASPYAVGFYEKNGFIYQTVLDMSSSTRRMYIPLKLYQEA